MCIMCKTTSLLKYILIQIQGKKNSFSLSCINRLLIQGFLFSKIHENRLSVYLCPGYHVKDDRT